MIQYKDDVLLGSLVKLYIGYMAGMEWGCVGVKQYLDIKHSIMSNECSLCCA